MIDEDTGYVLAALFRSSWSAAAAKRVIRKALTSAGPRGSVISCVYQPSGTNASGDGRSKVVNRINEVIKKEFPETPHILSAGRPAPVPFTLDRIYTQGHNTTRRFRTVEAGQRCLDGGTVICNYFIGREELGGQTPGQAARISVPFTGWVDVVKSVTRGWEPIPITRRL